MMVLCVHFEVKYKKSALSKMSYMNKLVLRVLLTGKEITVVLRCEILKLRSIGESDIKVLWLSVKYITVT